MRPPPAIQPFGLIVENPIHDFGTVGQLETLHAEYRFVNHFPSAVNIQEILKGCSCADVDFSPRRLEPNESGKLTISWRIGGRRGKATEVVTVIAVPEETGGTAVVPVRLTAVVEPDVVCEPTEVRFERKQPGKQVLRFAPGRMSDVRILTTYPSLKALQATIDPGTGTVEVRFDPTKLDENDLSASVMVQTTSPKEPWVTVPVTFTGLR